MPPRLFPMRFPDSGSVQEAKAASDLLLRMAGSPREQDRLETRQGSQRPSRRFATVIPRPALLQVSRYFSRSCTWVAGVSADERASQYLARAADRVVCRRRWRWQQNELSRPPE